MPFYEYEPDDAARSCDDCRAGFEVRQGIHDDALTVCPSCGAPCHRVLSSFSFHTTDKTTLSQSNLERHGFTQYKRSGKGVYEKTAGKGPNVIAKED